MTTEILYVTITAAWMVLFILLELFLPARVYDKAMKQRAYIVNSLILFSNSLVTYLLQISAIVAVVVIYSPSSAVFTIMPVWMQAVVGVIILDFFIWVWHWLNHKVKLLWAFHKCHHSEQYLNASSALRFHIGELLLSVVWKSAILIITGIPLWVFLLSEFLLTMFAIFHHANIKLSPKVRFYIEWCFITPYLHRVHHSSVRLEHDSNYGVIFTWWDKLFFTRHKLKPVQIGLSGISEKTFFSFLSFPFRKK